MPSSKSRSIQSRVRDSAADRRKTTRVKAQIDVTFEVDHKWKCRGFVLDLSEGGVLLLSAERLPSDAYVLVNLPLPMSNGRQHCVVFGKIVRIDKRSVPTLKAYGIQFDREIPKATVDKLRDYVLFKTGAGSSDLSRSKADRDINLDTIAFKALKQASKPGLSKKTIPILHSPWLKVIAIFLILIGVSTIYISIKERRHGQALVSKLSNTIPLSRAWDDEGVLYVKLEKDWLKATSSAEIDTHLKKFTKKVEKLKYRQVILLDGQEQRFAVIWISRGPASKSRIRRFQ